MVLPEQVMEVTYHTMIQQTKIFSKNKGSSSSYLPFCSLKGHFLSLSLCPAFLYDALKCVLSYWPRHGVIPWL
jgi:hypothetical protein